MGSVPENVLLELSGAQELVERYGKAPSFHDAEVISFILLRSGVSRLTVQPFPPDDPSVVHFDLQRIVDLELADFSCQNVINSLVVERCAKGGSGVTYRLSLRPCYGLQGWIEAEDIVVALG